MYKTTMRYWIVQMALCSRTIPAPNKMRNATHRSVFPPFIHIIIFARYVVFLFLFLFRFIYFLRFYGFSRIVRRRRRRRNRNRNRCSYERVSKPNRTEPPTRTSHYRENVSFYPRDMLPDGIRRISRFNPDNNTPTVYGKIRIIIIIFL